MFLLKAAFCLALYVDRVCVDLCFGPNLVQTSASHVCKARALTMPTVVKHNILPFRGQSCYSRTAAWIFCSGVFDLSFAIDAPLPDRARDKVPRAQLPDYPERCGKQDTRRCFALQKSRLVSTPQCVFVKHSTDIIGEKDGKGLIFKKSMDTSVIFIFLSMADHIWPQSRRKAMWLCANVTRMTRSSGTVQGRVKIRGLIKKMIKRN